MEYPGILDIKSNCTGCGACADACRKGCLSMVEDEHGFNYPHVNLSECLMCRACSNVCHVVSGSNSCCTPSWKNKSQFWAYQIKDRQILENSTSGGAFSLFADYVLKNGGVVFATRYNGAIEQLEFDSTDNFKLEDFRKSRYIESNTNHIFPIIRKQLRSGRLVLFCGTPCQVASVNSFFHGNEKKNLITINFICHGVPSNKHFHQWLHAKYPHVGELENIDFRYKNKEEGWGWHDMCLSIKEKSGRNTRIPYTESSFYLSFCENDLLRESCYKCQIINSELSDITIGDYWGVRNNPSIYDDNEGISLVILHSVTAQNLFQKISKQGLFKQLSWKNIEYAFFHRQYSTANREKFEEGVKKHGYVEMLDRKYKMKMLKYKIERLFKLKELYLWLKR